MYSYQDTALSAFYSRQSSARPSFPLLPITLPRTLDCCASFEADARSIFVCSYPKSGTTWLQFVLYTLCTRGKRPLDHISYYSPFFENDKSWVHADSGPSRLADHFKAGHAAIGYQLFNTHLWLDMLPKGKDARIVYVARSAKDVALSFFAHLSHQAPEDGGFTGTWEEFFEQWCAGGIAFGKWADHLKSFLGAPTRDPRILVLSYEEMKSDLELAVRRVARHCGIDITDEEISACLPRFDISWMKKNNHLFHPRSVKWVDKGDGYQFVNKGTSGRGKARLSAVQETSFDEMIQREFPADEAGGTTGSGGVPRYARPFVM